MRKLIILTLFLAGCDQQSKILTPEQVAQVLTAHEAYLNKITTVHNAVEARVTVLEGKRPCR